MPAQAWAAGIRVTTHSYSNFNEISRALSKSKILCFQCLPKSTIASKTVAMKRILGVIIIPFNQNTFSESMYETAGYI